VLVCLIIFYCYIRLSSPEGHLYCKSCIYENLLTQKQTQEHRHREYAEELRQYEELKKAQEDAARAASIATFEAIETGIHHVVTVAPQSEGGPPASNGAAGSKAAGMKAPSASPTSTVGSGPRPVGGETPVVVVPTGVPVVKRVRSREGGGADVVRW